MNQTIILQPSEVWDYYQSNISEFKTKMHEIASCEEYGITVYLAKDESESLWVYVEADNNIVYTELIVSEEDGIRTVQKVYDEYLTCRAIELMSDTLVIEDYTKFDEEDAISERESDLDTFTLEYVIGVISEADYVEGRCTDAILDDIKEHILEYLSRKHKLEIYRPMYLEDENGEDFYTDYPYECMEFDDKDNPIYKN